jgi:hypothetical protein
MSTVQLPSSIPDPKEVGGGIVEGRRLFRQVLCLRHRGRQKEFPCERLFEIQHQSFMATGENMSKRDMGLHERLIFSPSVKVNLANNTPVATKLESCSRLGAYSLRKVERLGKVVDDVFKFLSVEDDIVVRHRERKIRLMTHFRAGDLTCFKDQSLGW